MSAEPTLAELRAALGRPSSPEELASLAARAFTAHARARTEEAGGVWDPIEFKNSTGYLWEAALDEAGQDQRGACRVYATKVVAIVTNPTR